MAAYTQGYARLGKILSAKWHTSETRERGAGLTAELDVFGHLRATARHGQACG